MIKNKNNKKDGNNKKKITNKEIENLQKNE